MGSISIARMSDLELKIPPPAVLALCGVLAWFIARSVDSPLDIPDVVATSCALLLALLGCALALSAILGFRSAQTTIDPMKPDSSTSLVTSGVFRFTRNPMYLALLLVLAGWVVYLGSVVATMVLAVFVMYISRFQIRPEERILESKFGAVYAQYRAQVRRWI